LIELRLFFKPGTRGTKPVNRFRQFICDGFHKSKLVKKKSESSMEINGSLFFRRGSLAPVKYRRLFGKVDFY